MKQTICLLLTLLCIISACQDYDAIEPDVKAKRTVIVYMAAENSLYGYSINDTTEMVSAAAKVPDNVNFVIYLDGAKYPGIYTITAKHGLKAWKKYQNDQDSADSTIMLNTLKEIAEEFPAEHYGLVMWSHGTGWVNRKGAKRKDIILIDNNRNSSASNAGSEMNISELRWTLDNFKHLDYIFFDACFMQSIEVAYELRNTADYLIGSPAEIPAAGAPYDKIMSALCDGNTAEIVNQYYEAYKNHVGVVLSAIDCSKLEDLANKTAQFVPILWTNKSELNTSGIQYYAPFVSSNGYRPEPFDMNSAMHKYLSEKDYLEWKTFLDAAVPVRKASSSWTSAFYSAYLTDPDYYGGVSMFIPNSKYEEHEWNSQFQTTQWYVAAGWAQTGW